MKETQIKNWEIIEQQRSHVLCDCNQRLLSNQQLDFSFDTIAYLLSMLSADNKCY